MSSKRLSLAFILSLIALLPAFGQAQVWDFAAYTRAMSESSRQIGAMDEKAFLAVQERKTKVLEEI